MSDQNTYVWINPVSRHQYEEGPMGNLLNRQEVAERPAWVDSVAPIAYGPVIPWEGGECPEDAATQVRCFFRQRGPYVGSAIWEHLSPDAAASMWQHAPFGTRHDSERDIIAYQVRVA